MKNVLGWGASALLLLASVSASATVIESTYSVDAHSSGSGLLINTADVAPNAFSYDLSVGQSVSFGLFDIWTGENSLDTGFFSCGADCDPRGISVNFGLIKPETGQGSVDGNTRGQFTGFLSFNQQGEVNWDGPLDIAFGAQNDGLFQISLSDETFNKGLFGLHSGRENGATVQANLTLVSDASAADVPEPGTFGLFTLALAAIGFGVSRRRKLTGASRLA